MSGPSHLHLQVWCLTGGTIAIPVWEWVIILDVGGVTGSYWLSPSLTSRCLLAFGIAHLWESSKVLLVSSNKAWWCFNQVASGYSSPCGLFAWCDSYLTIVWDKWHFCETITFIMILFLLVLKLLVRILKFWQATPLWDKQLVCQGKKSSKLRPIRSSPGLGLHQGKGVLR